MKKLSDLLLGTHLMQTAGPMDMPVQGLTQDSRQVKPTFAFVAVKGTQTDGHTYIDKALGLGASVIICEVWPEELQKNVTYLQVDDAATALGQMASHFYGNPSKKMKVVAITGTNGKTTVATLLFQLFSGLGYKCGLLSTVRNLIGDETEASTHTTPDAVSLQSLLARMAKAGCTHVFMEASSHAIHQKRIAGLHLEGAVFTNITHDHLDYHGTMPQYIKAKKALFDGLPANAFALTNADEKRGKVMVQNTKAQIRTYGLQTPADFKARFLSATLQGNELDIDGQLVWLPQVGRFNAQNCLAVYGVALLMGEDSSEVLQVLSALPGAAGRFEAFRSPSGVTVIVDYAHTPDALKNVLETIRELSEEANRVITVVGCGGDRDRTKRPEMAAIAVKYSDKIILTSDNPRTEQPEAIIDEMAEGVMISKRKRLVREVDRARAIEMAIGMAEPGDVVLIAGKGHEDYQEINGIKLPFDDRKQVAAVFAAQVKNKK